MDRPGARIIALIRIPLLLLFSGLLVSATTGFAQEASQASISGESEQVLVRAFVYDRTLMALDNPVGSTSWNWDNAEMRDLRADKFHLFEDGKEQKIQSVTFREQLYCALSHDNVSEHDEYSDTPQGKWICPDLGAGWSLPPEVHFYVLGYVPPKSDEGSCHEIRVKVDRPNSVVYARDQYCNTKHTASDPLNGTRFGHQMQEFASSAEAGKIGLSLQTSFFYENRYARVDIALEFPWNSLKHEWRIENGQYSEHATIGVLGLVYKKDGILATRFSSFACCSSDYPEFCLGSYIWRSSRSPRSNEDSNLL